MCAMFEYLDGNAEGADAHVKLKYALEEVFQLNSLIRAMPSGPTAEDLGARAKLMSAAVMLHVYGHAPEDCHAGWSSDSCRKMVKEREELVEGWSSWAYKIMCTEPGLECGVFNKEHRRQKFAVD